MERSLVHLGIIMDGNRRWAKKQGLSFGDGYAQGGFDAVKRTVEFCLDRGIKHLSLYAFSLENLKRPQAEQNFLFDTIVSKGTSAIDLFKEHQVRVFFVGDRSVFPDRVRSVCETIENETKDFSRIFVHILFCYGGRQELVAGCRLLAQKIKQGDLQPEDITEKVMNDVLWTANIPDPELIVRTSGVSRLSNFLLFKSAYSELCFLDCLWPEITRDDLEYAVNKYYKVARNFGV